MVTALIFIIVISILVFVHELGHFVMAKRAGMRVDEFGFGFPPRLWGIKRGETVYSINWIPFGGFVRIFGEDGGHRDDGRSFGSKSFGKRMGVIVAGVAMNFLFAVVLLMLGNFLGLRIGLIDDAMSSHARDKQVQIVEVSAGSPAQQADIRILDEITQIKTAGGAITRVATPQDVQDFAAAHQGQTATLTLKRGTEALDKQVVLRAHPPAGQGPLGVSLVLTGVVSYPWYEALWRGVYDAIILTVNTAVGYFMLFKTLFVKRALMADVSGPIGIATLTGQAARVGFSYLVQFVAMISVNLAVLNIVPFPALDGGRAALLIVEKIKGSPLNKSVEGFINAAGFVILIALMVFITAKDIGKFF